MKEMDGVPTPGELDCTGTRPYSKVPKLVSINSPGSANLSLALRTPCDCLKGDSPLRIFVFSTNLCAMTSSHVSSSTPGWKRTLSSLSGIPWIGEWGPFKAWQSPEKWTPPIHGIADQRS